MPLLNIVSQGNWLRCLAGVCVFLFSAVCGAAGLEQKVISEMTDQPEAVQTIFAMFHEALRRQGPSIPVETVNPSDYKRLVIELRELASEFEGSGRRFSSEEDRKKWTTRLDMLAARVGMLANATKTGRCANLSIDQVSASRSGGDWSRVKKTDGSPIQPGSYDHLALFWFFRHGCGGEKDLVTARKVLFDISDLEQNDPSKRYGLRPEVRHCQAEIWARYGIGGSLDEELAQKFSRRFTMAAWFVNGDDGPEEREKIAKRYPAAAADNFKCPVGHDSNRIDPRDPWKDLW